MRKTRYLLPFLAFAAMISACPAPAAAASLRLAAWPENRSFRAVSLTDNGHRRPIVAGTTIQLTFGANNRLSARAGCNSGSAEGRVMAHRLILSSLVTTRMACAAARMDQDRWVALLLTGRPVFSLRGHHLTLRNGGTQMRLVESG
jgi:heat shock protein HslJ